MSDVPLAAKVEAADAAERAYLWPRSWLVAGRAHEVAGAGQYFTWQRTGVPLIVVGGVDGTVRAFYNSCRHRGAPVVREPRGRSRALRCQYHSWTYDTAGRLVSVPDERDFVGLDFAERGLVPVSCAVIDGWVLVSEQPAALPPALPELPAAAKVLARRTYRFAANWKRAAAALSRRSGARSEAIFPNGLLRRDGASDLAVFAWPITWPRPLADACEVEAMLLGEDGRGEDSAELSRAWQERLAALGAEIDALIPGGLAAHDALEGAVEAFIEGQAATPRR